MVDVVEGVTMRVVGWWDLLDVSRKVVLVKSFSSARRRHETSPLPRTNFFKAEDTTSTEVRQELPFSEN